MMLPSAGLLVIASPAAEDVGLMVKWWPVGMLLCVVCKVNGNFNRPSFFF